MCALQIILSADPSLGRVDYSLLSDQVLMELLIDGFDDETKKMYQDDHGMYLVVCEWRGIRCDQDERVVEVWIDSTNVVGSLELCYAPPKMQEVYIRSGYKSKLTGSVDFTCLPEGMKELYLHNNQLTGEVNLTQLPDGMKVLNLQNNQLSGSLVLKRLPPSLRLINVRGNSFNAAAVIDSEARTDVYLQGSGVTSVVDENGKEVDSKRFFA